MPERRTFPTMHGLDLGMPGEIRPRRLFDDISTEDAFLKQHQKALATIAELPSGALLTSSLDALVDLVVAAYRIDPLTLHWDARTVDSTESSMNVEGGAAGGATEDDAVAGILKTAIVEFIPFSGAGGLFDMRPWPAATPSTCSPR